MHLDGWTLLLQALNLAVLVALLRRLFYRPLLAIIDARRAAIDAEQAKAADALRDAQAQAGRLAEDRASVASSRDAVLEEARVDADRVHQAAVDQARQSVDAALAEGRRQIDKERRDASLAVQDEAASLAVSLARRLLALVPRRDGDAPFALALVDRVRATAGADRASWFAPEMPRVAEFATAQALDAETVAAVRSSLAQTLGQDVQVVFRVEEALIAGAELRLPHGVLAMNWATELERARTLTEPLRDEATT